MKQSAYSLMAMLCLCTFWDVGNAQKFDSILTVQLTAHVKEYPPQIELKWIPRKDAEQYRIFKKETVYPNWGQPLVVLNANIQSWIDTEVNIGEIYHYKVERTGGIRTGTGYLNAGIKVTPIFNKGIALIVLDTIALPQDNFYFLQYLNDLQKEGWQYHLIKVNRNDSPPQVKQKIVTAYQEDTQHTNTLVLVGHVPVPYSGAVYPDGHGQGRGDHQGAWPADPYYADMDGSWTDCSTTETSGADPRNHNVPGDGKFDQYSIPEQQVELGTGRIDFANLSTFPQSELVLLENYFKKNHAFRTQQFVPEYRGLVQNNFGNLPEGFGQNGLKNFTPMFGAEKVSYTKYAALTSDSYLWAYAAGAGTFTGINGICSEQDLLYDSLQAVFMMHFGSFFGDWDHKEHNFLRAALASGTVLTNCWAGRPNWFFYPMAMGKTIGYCTALSMNNQWGHHLTGHSESGIHMALMGDPTLTMYVVKTPSYLHQKTTTNTLEFSWEASDTPVEGYFLLRQVQGRDTFELVHPQLVKDTSIAIPLAIHNLEKATYWLRAAQLIETASGSFYQLSPAVLATSEVAQTLPVELLDWKATAQNDGMLLHWSTATETNNRGFEIQRSADAQHWTTLGFVAGKGNTMQPQQYAFKDRQPLNGNNYFRLKQLDFDDHFEYSPIAHAFWNDPIPLNLQISPNPTQDNITLTGEALAHYHWQLFDLKGTLLTTFPPPNANTMKLSLTSFPSGTYLLTARNHDQHHHFRVSKE